MWNPNRQIASFQHPRVTNTVQSPVYYNVTSDVISFILEKYNTGQLDTKKTCTGVFFHFEHAVRCENFVSVKFALNNNWCPLCRYSGFFVG